MALPISSFNERSAEDRSKTNNRQRLCGTAIARCFTVILVVITTGLFFFLRKSAYDPYRFFSGSYSVPCYGDSMEENRGNFLLKNTLEKAAMEDKKTVIITTVNAAWIAPNSIFDLFLESFRIGNQTQHLLNHLIVVALDPFAYSHCMNMNSHFHCYELTTSGVNFSDQKGFMTGDYLKMMWRRILFLTEVLELGYDFVFTDADVMWFRNPFPRFYPEGDIQIACDNYAYNSTDRRNSPNGGFVYVRSSGKTTEFYNFWYNAQAYFPDKHDQDALNIIKSNPFLDRVGLKLLFLETSYFGGFCQPSQDFDKVVTMHANCCIGLENKIHDLRMVIGDWKGYANDKSVTSWTVPRNCG